MAEFSIDQFGDRSADFRAGLVASAIANQWIGEGDEPIMPHEWFGYDQAEQPREQTWQEQLAIVEMLNTALGGDDLRKKGEATD